MPVYVAPSIEYVSCTLDNERNTRTRSQIVVARNKWSVLGLMRRKADPVWIELNQADPEVALNELLRRIS